MKRQHWACLLLGVLLCGPAVAGESETIYYAVFLGGKKMGHRIMTRQVTDQEVVNTRTMELTISRGGFEMTVRKTESYVETPKGKPLGFTSIQDTGAGVQKTVGKVTPDGKIHTTITASGQSRQQTLDWPEGAMMPEGIRLLALEKGLKEGTTYKVRTFTESMLQPMNEQVTIGATRKVDLLGRVVTLTEVVSTLHFPGASMTMTNYVDANLVPQKSLLPMIGMVLEIVACDKAVALSKNDPVDILDKSVLPSPVPPKTFVGARSATYTLTPKGKKKLTGIVATDSQTVKAGKDGSLVVTVRPVEAATGKKFPYKGKDAAVLEALKPTRFVQSDHKKVIELARKAVGDTRDAAKAAKRIEVFVRKHMTVKSLSVGYATAAEVAASGEGDCTEHAVLAAAMLRAVGIPARVVLGYVHSPKFLKHENTFIGHAWVQALIGDKWVDLDATRGGIGPTHIAQSVGNGDPTDFFSMLESFGQFRIAKVTVEK